ncbi:myb/SANT-like DNA-binding domain-containing protein 4 [Pectinophora gossypiella]|uniref:myb/SANT-like DNA-binding domain-containing protein 4 n=1 Tax=Pectinophora gossypiella TaxID=13191 RepID=UPI00214E6C47|nr:myb/SANT-like DNA-binding domain-containing protein 4 [Pectinophora gossypiella]
MEFKREKQWTTDSPPVHCQLNPENQNTALLVATKAIDKGKKRERSVNFTIEETEYLISLIDARKQVIENKKSDAVTWQDKEKAWKAIELEYNNAGIGPFRDAKHLKVKFEAIKRDTRKKISNKNGNGNHVPLTPVENKVKEMILLSDDGNDTTYDSDQIDMSASDVLQIDMDIKVPYPETDRNSDISFEYPEEEPDQKKICVIQEVDSVPNTSQAQPEKVTDWKPASPKIFVKKLPDLCTTKSPKRYDKLVENKMEIIELQKKLLKEEIEEKKLKQQLLLHEIEHKNQLHLLEKQHMLLKIELLRNELQKQQ